MLGAILTGLLAIVLGMAMVRWPSTFDKYLTARSATTPVMGWVAIALGVMFVLSGVFVDQTP